MRLSTIMRMLKMALRKSRSNLMQWGRSPSPTPKTSSWCLRPVLIQEVLTPEKRMVHRADYSFRSIELAEMEESRLYRPLILL